MAPYFVNKFVVLRNVRHTEMTNKTRFLRNKIEIIKTGRHNRNLDDRYIIQESPVFVCLLTLRISFKEKPEMGIQNNFTTLFPSAVKTWSNIIDWGAARSATQCCEIFHDVDPLCAPFIYFLYPTNFCSHPLSDHSDLLESLLRYKKKKQLTCTDLPSLVSAGL